MNRSGSPPPALLHPDLYSLPSPSAVTLADCTLDPLAQSWLKFHNNHISPIATTLMLHSHIKTVRCTKYIWNDYSTCCTLTSTSLRLYYRTIFRNWGTHWGTPDLQTPLLRQKNKKIIKKFLGSERPTSRI